MTSVQEQLCDILDELDEGQDGSIPAAELERDDIMYKIMDRFEPHLAEQLENKHMEDEVNNSPHTGVSVDLNAETGANVNAPVLAGNTFTGPINFNYSINSSQNEEQNYLRTVTSETVRQDELVLRKFLKTHKNNMKEKAEHIFEGKKENEAHLKDVYTELYITEGDIIEVNHEHEILKIDDAFKTQKAQGRPINCNELLSLLRKNNRKKIVLTKGIAGIGKTVSVHKFILDWTEGKANQDIDCMFLLPFREINLMKNEEFNFHEFLLEFYPELQGMEKTKLYKKCNFVFIFDGLDESRLPLKFESRALRSVERRSSVDLLFTNLVKGNLLPSALIWVTSRPAAASQIPPEYVGLYTEVRGFTDKQKEEYFRKRIPDETQASKIISCIKTSRSLYIMCYIPVFCWITATVLQEIFIKNNGEDIPTTLTEMYIHYLLIQMNMKNQKYDENIERNYKKLLDLNKGKILTLAKLAFEQMRKEYTMFDEEELKKCGINVSEDSECTGMFTEILKKEAGLHEMKVFCFVHLSVQEFLAALHVFLCYMNKSMEELQFFFEDPQGKVTDKLWFLKDIFKKVKLHDLLQRAIDKAMQSERGHWDLFLRFLLGISLESNQKMLKGLITHNKDTTKSISKIIKHIKQLQHNDISAEASINLFYCLVELNDNSLFKEVQRYIHSDSHPERELTSSMCSVLTYILLMSEEVLDEFNLKMYKTSPAGYMRLVPSVRGCRKALFDSCGLDESCCESLASALQSSNCPLKELDLSNNDLQDSGVKLISDALKSPNCQLGMLRLKGCKLTGQSCETLVSVLQSPNSHLRELDLSNNDLQDSGMMLLSDGLKNSNCQLEILRLEDCRLIYQCCESLASVLQSSNSSLRELDLSNNDLQDSGMILLSDGLKSPNCQLEILRLPACNLTGQCCESLASALQLSNSPLRELDLSFNNLRDLGVKMLSEGLKSPHCQLNVLRVAMCNLRGWCCECLASALQLSNSPLSELDLSNNNLQDSGVRLICDALKSPNCQLKILRLAMCYLINQHCESLTSALQTSDSSLRDLDLSNNDLQDSGVKLLSDWLKSPNCQLEILRLSGCMVTEEGCRYLASALSSNPSHLRQLDLSYNHPGTSGVQLLSERLNDPNCTLDKLNVSYGGEVRITAGLHKYSCDLTLDPNTANPYLWLSEKNKKVTCVQEKQSYSDHPDRFDEFGLVLCRDSLCGRCYWEAEWSGYWADVAVSYKGISRKGDSYECLFGHNEKSWSLICFENSFTACHNNKETVISAPSLSTKRVGVYLDLLAGNLSFYSISDTLTHLHTFFSKFTKPLYVGFGIGFEVFNSSLSLCEIKRPSVKNKTTACHTDN